MVGLASDLLHPVLTNSVYASVYLTQRRTRLKRQMNERDIVRMSLLLQKSPHHFLGNSWNPHRLSAEL